MSNKYNQKNKYKREKSIFDKKREDVPKAPETAAEQSDFFNNRPSTAVEELTPEETELVEVLSEAADSPSGFPDLGHDSETAPLPELTEDKEPDVDEIQNESDFIATFKVTSIRAHVFVEPHLHSRPITAAARGNLLPIFDKNPAVGWCEVQVLNRRLEKVRGFIEVVRGKVIS